MSLPCKAMAQAGSREGTRVEIMNCGLGCKLFSREMVDGISGIQAPTIRLEIIVPEWLPENAHYAKP